MHYRIKKAFTMLELVFVIIILGIVSSIGAEMIANVYESYIVQRAVHNASIRTELAINQLANRLAYRIDGSMLARLPQTNPTYTATGATPTIYNARTVPFAYLNTHTALEWIGYDNDSFSAYITPAWSGFTDLNTTVTTTTNLHTPGSDTSKLSNYYTGGQKRAIVFLGTANYSSNALDYYTPTCMYNAHGCIFPVDIGAANNQTLTMGTGVSDGNRTAGQMIYTEFYQLADSAYAVVPENNHTLKGANVPVYDLKFYYGYQPWLGENYKNGKVATLIENVSVFRFRKEQNSIRIKLCTVEPLGDNQTLSICKEKAVIR